MKAKAKILVVEDEIILHDRLKTALSEQFYEVAEYCPSYEDAMQLAHSFKPDIALLDISLKGEKTGIDVGRELNKSFNIPFIYLTEYNDDHTFYQGLETKHAHYMVKTKPKLDIKALTRVIQTVLNNHDKAPIINQEGIFCLVDYLENIKNASSNLVSRKPVKFEDVVYFSNRESDIKEHITRLISPNYLRVKSISQVEPLFLKVSLSQLIKLVPDYFVRINESYIINIKSKELAGRINGTRIQMADEVLTVSKTYKEEFNQRLKHFYAIT